MLVADSRRRSDPRVLYGILAESALEQLQSKSPEETERRAYLQNLIRLLEMYQYNSLRRPAPRAVLDRRKADLKSRERELAANVEVEHALDAARQAVYEGFERAQMVEHLKFVFGRLMRNEAADIEQADLQRVKAFLEAFAESLRT
jgi:hypothetical protein